MTNHVTKITNCLNNWIFNLNLDTLYTFYIYNIKIKNNIKRVYIGSTYKNIIKNNFFYNVSKSLEVSKAVYFSNYFSLKNLRHGVDVFSTPSKASLNFASKAPKIPFFGLLPVLLEGGKTHG